ncbi:SDR family oxidoreductase [Lichenicoccus sp.]|uniref:SDR family oxidoreductase n=1 Tax=Lichenicoccus sp. TaxID=2781899 RepID=UPI003D0AB286
MGRYDGKHVLVTGGVSGIGLATARLLVEQGARVMVTGRNENTVASARDALGPNAVAVVSDTASLADIETLAHRVKSEFGTLDALLVCAGQNVFAAFEQVTEADYDQALAVNAKGAFFTVQKLAPLMPEGSGVVFTTSVANELGIPMISAYAASKAALRSMARSMAQELLPKGIRVNAVSPGPIDSGVLYKTMPKEAADQTIKQMTEQNPMKRFGRPEEVGRALIFLAFEATFTTGAELVVDGGGSQL